MIIYSIENRYGKFNSLKKALHVEGKIDCSHIDELRKIILESVMSCDHLELNLEGIDECDPSFKFFVCYTHKLAQQFNKKLSLKGKLPATSLKDYWDTNILPDSVCEDPDENVSYIWKAVIKKPKHRVSN